MCNQILEATPETFADWDAMTEQQLLDALPPAVATVEATRGILQTQIDTLRNRGVSWAAIGTALGISRQAAWERFSEQSPQEAFSHPPPNNCLPSS